MNKLLIILFFLCYPSTAYAYLDPGTTGIIFSTLIGLFVAGFAYIKKFYINIKNFFKRLFVKNNQQEENSSKKTINFIKSFR